MSTERPAPGARAVYVTRKLVTVHVADHTGVFQCVGQATADSTWTRSGAYGPRTLCDVDTLRWALDVVTRAHLAWLDNPEADLSRMSTHTLGRAPGSQRSTLVPLQEVLL